MQWWAHGRKTQESVSSLSMILSLCFQYSEMPCSNLFPGCFWGYYRSFWQRTRQEMWSSSSGAVCFSEPAPRDPLCDSLDLCHCPHSTQNNFCCAVFFVSIVCGHFCLNKSTALCLTFLQMLFGNCASGQCRVFSSWFCRFHKTKSLWVTVAAGIQQFLKALG